MNVLPPGFQLRHDVLSAHFAGLRILKLDETVDPGIERTSRMEAEACRKHLSNGTANRGAFQWMAECMVV